MPILDLQRRMVELGRIRTGQLVDGRNGGRKRPEKLETFRLTSASRETLDGAAQVYGGEVRAWQSPDGDQWELVITADSLDIIIPPGQSISQWYELWTGGGCQRRCNGQREMLHDTPCLCPADPAEKRDLAANGEACKPTTRLSVILPQVPGLGVWMLVAHGYYAAVELMGTAEFLEEATARGQRVAARLRLDQRTVKRPGEPTKRFAVPVIDLPGTRVADLLGTGTVTPETPLLAPVNKRERVPRPGLPPGPEPTRDTFEKPRAGFGPVPELPSATPMVVEGEVVDAPEPAARPAQPISPAEFARLISEAGVASAVLKAAVKAVNHDAPTFAALTDAERGEAWRRLS